jgi:PTS system beta-glucosides-specific IIC component
MIEQNHPQHANASPARNFAPGKNAVDRVIALISSLFLPFVNLLVSVGILKGALVLLTVAKLVDEGSATYAIANGMSDAFFYFIPVFLAYTAGKRFDVNPFTSMAVACVILYPGVTALMSGAEAITFFGLPIMAVQYQASIIPILLAIYCMKFVERMCGVIPETFRGMLMPPICIIIIVPLTLALFGPVGMVVGKWLAGGYTVVYGLSPLAAGFLLGTAQQLMVVFGLHWALFPIVLNNIAVYGFDTLIPLFGGAIFAQGGAALAIAMRAREKKNKSIALSAALTTFFGITEPALFTVNLPLKKPMVCACVAGGVGSALIGFFKGQAVSFALPALTTLPVFMGNNFTWFAIALAVSFALAFILTMFVKLPDIDAAMGSI